MRGVMVLLAMVAGTLGGPVQKDCSHLPRCCPSKGQEFPEEWLRRTPVPVTPPAPAGPPPSPALCRAGQDGPLHGRAISPWRYELDRDLNRFPQDLYHARCLCPHCVSLQTGSHMDPRGNSEPLYHNQTVFYRRPCLGQPRARLRYCLEPRLYPVALACVCVRPRVLA